MVLSKAKSCKKLRSSFKSVTQKCENFSHNLLLSLKNQELWSRSAPSKKKGLNKVLVLHKPWTYSTTTKISWNGMHDISFFIDPSYYLVNNTLIKKLINNKRVYRNSIRDNCEKSYSFHPFLFLIFLLLKSDKD